MKPKQGFSFYLSCDINLQVKVKVAGLQGQLPSFRRQRQEDSVVSRPTALLVVAKIFGSEEPIGLETKTTYAECTGDGCTWGEWLTFCVKYRDLPEHAQLALNVFELAEAQGLTRVGGTTMPLFNKKGRIKTGLQKLKVWEGREAHAGWPSTTPGKIPLRERGQLGQLEHLVKLYARGDIPQLEWLDSLTLQEVRRLQEEESLAWRNRPALQLLLELPAFPHAVLYQQPQVALPPATAPKKDSGVGQDRSQAENLIIIHDPEVGKDNPAEMKAQKLARSLTRGIIDRDLKPNSEERKRIAAVLRLPPNRPLHGEERSLLWRFRFSLTQDKRALTKFLKCVDWSDVSEAKQAIDLMAQWVPIDVADALELLSPDFRHEDVRSHAVGSLGRTSDEELLYYLLQLVQALRYEATDTSRLAKFLITRANVNPAFAISLHWYLFTEWEDPSFGSRASSVHSLLVNELQRSPNADMVIEAIRRQSDMMSQLSYIVKELKGAKLKAARGTERIREMLSESGPCSELTSIRVPLPFNPSIMLEGLVPSECSCFKSAQLPLRLSSRMDLAPIQWTAARSASPSDAPGTSPALLHTSPSGGSGSAPTRFPVAAGSTGVMLQGDQYRCVFIYKKGDDLRQDQFVLQMFSLMDRLLKRENLDLRLMPYRVLPTGSDDGLVEFVPSVALAKILHEHRSSITRYLAQFHADPNGPFGLRAEVLENFVRSCAGYCVMTYILGVGDRHLDNLMVTADGRLFHIDFGYILGQDPKPFPPPMKLCKEMIEAMGGSESPYYVSFRMYACEAYNILRKSADLILSLLHLMAGSSVAAIREDPEKALLKVQEKLRLDFDDEQAVEWMQQLINESATALMPQIVETTHRWAQYWR